MKNINWMVRIKNKAFWIAFIPAILLLIQVIAAVFGYTFDFGDLGNKLLAPKKEAKQYHSFDHIKKYVDDHFSEHDFSLDDICSASSKWERIPLTFYPPSLLFPWSGPSPWCLTSIFSFILQGSLK